MITPRYAPMGHQAEYLEKHADQRDWALFWEQGTGKSKSTIDGLALAADSGEVDAAIILAPSNVFPNWTREELPKHWPSDAPPITSLAWSSGSAKTKWFKNEVQSLLSSTFPVLAMSYDQLMTEAGKKVVWDLLRTRKCSFIADESARLKNPAAKRTKRAVSAAVYATQRRILTGTPIANSPFDAYSQIRFLEPTFWRDRFGIGSYTSFKHHFADIISIETNGGGRFEKVESWRNLDTLYEALRLVSSRYLKEDVLDLPPKVYQRRYHDFSPEQRRAYKQLKEEAALLLADGEWIDCSQAIVMLLRLQQVACGFVTNSETGRSSA